MIRKYIWKRDQQGFTLTEIAMVLVIVGLTLAVGVNSFNDFRRNAALTSTDLYLESARTALLDYLARNGHLPCPDTDDDGQENAVDAVTGGTCAASTGTLPWSDLGLLDDMGGSGETPFYSVNMDVVADTCLSGDNEPCYFENESAPLVHLRTLPVAGDAGSGNLRIQNHAGEDVADGLLAVLGSRGANFQAVNCNALEASEVENCDNDELYIMDVMQTRDGAVQFDDRLVWIDAQAAKGQMQRAGML